MSITVGLVSALIGLSAVVGTVFAVLWHPPVWFVFGFEFLTILAAVFGLMFGLGRFRDGPALCLLSVAGAVGLCSLLAYQIAPQVQGFDLRIWLLARALLAGILVFLAGVVVLMRNPRSAMPPLFKGAAFLSAFCVSVAGLWIARSHVMGLAGWLQFVVWLVGAVWLLCLLAPAVHLLVRAFEVAGEARRVPDAQ